MSTLAEAESEYRAALRQTTEIKHETWFERGGAKGPLSWCRGHGVDVDEPYIYIFTRRSPRDGLLDYVETHKSGGPPRIHDALTKAYRGMEPTVELRRAIYSCILLEWQERAR